MIKGVAAGLLAFALFATCDACVKAVGGSMSVYEILFFLTLASFATFGFAKPAEEKWSEVLHMHRPGLVFLRNGAGVLAGLFGVYGFTTLPLAETYSLLFLMPAFATILSIPILGEQVGWRRWLAVAAGFAGVLLVVRPGFRELHLGHLAAAIAAAFAAVSMITLRLVGRTEKRITLLATLYVSALTVDGLLMLLDFRVPGIRELAIVAIGGIIGGFGQIVMIAALRLAPANRVAPAQYSQILWAVVFGAAFFGEFPDAIAFAGMGLVVGSGLFTFSREEQLHAWSRRTLLLRDRQ
jgi:S-adenosylmethionine uptake transporter